MASERHYDITLHLDDVREMFNAPDVDPFSGKARYESGLQTIIDELRPKALTKKTRTTIILPGNRVEPDLDRKIRAALADGGPSHVRVVYTKVSCTWISA